MSDLKLTTYPPGEPIHLDNLTCPYCGVELATVESDKEHVVGRRFVPKGTLNGSWNLLPRSCKRCNGEKAKLEDDISSITLSALQWSNTREADQLASVEANRKGRSISRRTRKPVSESEEEHVIKLSLAPNAQLTATMIAPPQIDPERVYKLARLQLMGFFYLMTFDYRTRMGGTWVGGTYPYSIAHRPDWGNALQTAFAKEATKWPIRLVADTASGYFKARIWRHEKEGVAAWALEWNMSYRVVGFLGNRDAAQAIVNDFEVRLPPPFLALDGSTVRIRQDRQLDADDDLLFS